MPNGGVPIEMLLRPKGKSSVVVYCRANELTIYAHDDWEAKRLEATPLCKLNPWEVSALAWFLQYWAEERGTPPRFGDDLPGTHVDAILSVRTLLASLAGVLLLNGFR